MLNDKAYFSTIDHFVLSKRLLDSVVDARVVHSGDNPSNHSAIYLKIDTGFLNLVLEHPKIEERANWSRATEDAKAAFRDTLS